MTAILVTDGAGYIGSYTCVELLTAGYDVAAVDNPYNSSEKALEKVEEITGRKVKFYETDLLDQPTLKEVFDKEKIDSVTHFAGLRAMGESMRKPLEYYHNNITGTLILCGEMRSHGVRNTVLSSPATVHGDPAEAPVTESCPKGKITNPHGRTKGMLEQILTGLHAADPEWNVVLLRYFSPTGTYESGLVGEDPKGIPNNLVPYTAQVAVGKLDHLNVLDDDYDTPDSTGVRDYVHVVDLARGHVKVMQKLQDKEDVNTYNLGVGVGYSVLDVFHAYEKAYGRTLRYEIQPRCEGDVVTCYSNSAKAKHEPGWVAKKGIEEICTDPQKWRSMNPNGYRD